MTVTATDRIVAVRAHRGDKIHLATLTGPSIIDPGLRVVATTGLCGKSTARSVRAGSVLPQRVRPGESPALTPTCKMCLHRARQRDLTFPAPGAVIPHDFGIQYRERNET